MRVIEARDLHAQYISVGKCVWYDWYDVLRRNEKRQQVKIIIPSLILNSIS